MLYQLRNITRSYAGRTVVDIDELRVDEGLIYALVGPNGSGKTTLLSMLSFLNKPSGGTIFYKGSPVVWEEKNLHSLRREVIQVTQHPILFSTNVYRNIEYGLKIRGLAKKERRSRIIESLEMVGMKSFLNSKTIRLSGGETQRISIARALACRPQVLLFDEPTASVDAASQNRVEQIIRDIHTEWKISIVLCTHNQPLASRLAQKTIFLYQGKPKQSRYENIFPGIAQKTSSGAVQCSLTPDFSLPLNHDRSGPVELSISPLGIEIQKMTDSIASTAGTGIPGQIKMIQLEGTKIRLLIHAGIDLSALMTEHKFKNSNLTVGDMVLVTIPEHAVKLID